LHFLPLSLQERKIPYPPHAPASQVRNGISGAGSTLE
jgi:hypothetical protein